MSSKVISSPVRVGFSLLIASATWLYPAKEAKSNPQTVYSAIPFVSRTGENEGKLIVDSKAKQWAQFQSLVAEWKAARGATSSITQMSMLKPYQKIIAMGDGVVPLILAQLRSEGDEPDQWFWALRILTDVNPVRPEDQGDFLAMARAWIEWGESNAYVG